MSLLAPASVSGQCNNLTSLSFTNPTLETAPATEGQVGAIYRFSSVKSGTDALVQILAASNASLANIDLTSTGDDHAFQPKVNLDNQANNPSGTEGYMDFAIAFVDSGTTTLESPGSWAATAIDVDGDDYRLRESVGFQNVQTYTLELLTLLLPGSQEGYNMFSCLTTANQEGISTTATEHMVYTTYSTASTFVYRTRIIDDYGTDGDSDANDRMFSLNFNPCLINEFDDPTNFPIEWVSFDAQRIGERVDLNWITALEINNDHFVVERSIDGKLFEQIGQVDGVGNSTTEQSYRFQDEAPIYGRSYYRIKQVDFDGTFSYSHQVEVSTDLIRISAFPNPATEVMKVEMNGKIQPESIRMRSLMGQLMQAPIQSVGDGRWEIQLSHLTPGVYLLEISFEDQAIQTKKIVVNQ